MQNNSENNSPKRPKIHINLTWLYLLVMVAVFVIGFTSSKGGGSKEISYTQFRHYVDSGYIDRITVINKDYAEGIPGLEMEYLKIISNRLHSLYQQVPYRTDLRC